MDSENYFVVLMNTCLSRPGSARAPHRSIPHLHPVRACTDTQPPGSYTCAQQRGWSKCPQVWISISSMISCGFCATTCGRCSVSTPEPTPVPTPSPTPRPVPAAAANTVLQQVLNLHNSYRIRHEQTLPLVWDTNLEAIAQSWANRCVFQHLVRPENHITG